MTETIHLPNAEVEDEWNSDGTRFVRISTEEVNHELSYIIGQFQDRDFEVNSIDFKRNTVSFSKTD